MSHSGIVKWYDIDKNFGFIIEDGVENEEIFVHKTNILTLDQSLDKDQRVTFDVERKNNKLQATNVKPLDE